MSLKPRRSGIGRWALIPALGIFALLFVDAALTGMTVDEFKAEVSTFTHAPYDDAKKGGWIISSMKNDWKRIFAFE